MSSVLSQRLGITPSPDQTHLDGTPLAPKFNPGDGDRDRQLPQLRLTIGPTTWSHFDEVPPVTAEDLSDRGAAVQGGRPSVGRGRGFPGMEPNDLVLLDPGRRALIAGNTLIDRGECLDFPADWTTKGVPPEQIVQGLCPLLEPMPRRLHCR
jgi:hypothetical protein